MIDRLHGHYDRARQELIAVLQAHADGFGDLRDEAACVELRSSDLDAAEEASAAPDVDGS